MNLLKKRTSTISGISARLGSFLGETASVAATIPSSMYSGAKAGIENGQAATKETAKQSAVLSLVNVKNIGAAHRDAEAISNAIKNNKEKHKKLALCDIPLSEVQDEVSALEKAVKSSKETFEQRYGIGYDRFKSLVNRFDGPADFANTAQTFHSQAIKEITKEDKDLEETYSREKKELDEAYSNKKTEIERKKSFLKSMVANFIPQEG